MNNDAKKNQIIELATSEEFIPAEVPNETALKEYTKFPINEITGLGAALAELSSKARTAESTIKVNANGLYRCSFPKGINGELAKVKDGSGYLGAIIKKGEGLQAQARWNKVDAVTGKQSFTVPISPLNMFMAASLVEINHKLNQIQKTANDILEYQKAEVKAREIGDFETLITIYNELKLHLNDQKWQQSELLLVLDIKKESVRSMDLHKGQIEFKIGKTNRIHNGQQTKNVIDTIRKEFEEYRFSLFIYSFARFLEVLFYGDFSHDNLKAIKADINSKNIKYRECYTHTYNILSNEANTSIESKFLKGVSNASRKTGKAIHRIPLIKKGPLDDALVKAGQSVSNLDKKEINRSLSYLKENINSGAAQFIEGIKRIDELYNDPLEILIDKDCVYVKTLN